MPICELCSNRRFELVSTRIREGKGRIVRCRKCGLVIQDLGWDASRLRAYYEKEYQQTNSLVTGRSQSAREHFADRSGTIASVFDEVRPLLRRGMSVLEVGCGAGELLAKIKPYARRCVGVELNSAFVDFMRKDLGLEAYAEDVNRLDIEGGFDLVISISTLDHLPNPLETLRSMRRLLAPKGRIYVELPNVDEALNCCLPDRTRAMYNEFFWHRAHLFYFSRATVTRLFRKAGLDVRVASRHEYTLKNFLNWYFLGHPQRDFTTGLTDSRFFREGGEFERRMNRMLMRNEREFKDIMRRTFRGDNLCCIGRAR